jgi:phenylacetate-CoA ligase
VTLGDAVRIGSSTGTTGRPTLFFYGPRDLEVQIEVGKRNLWRHGLRPGMRFTHSWPQGLYPTGVTAGRQYLDLGILEIAVGPPFSRDVAADHLRFWEILRPDGFQITGSQLQLYEDAGTEAGVDVAKLLEGSILAFLEASCQFDGPRARIESAYGVSLRNIGGASEIPGLSTTDCRHHTGLHCAGDHFVVQVCDPATGREVPAGERGTLVVTAFGLDAIFVRYDLEDIVVRTPGACPCGETGPRYTLLGRGADMVTVAGRGILPIDIQLALDDEGAPEFQIVREGDGSALRLTVEAEGSGAAAALAGVLRERLGVPVEVRDVAPGTLPRATFKPRRIS